MPESIPGTNQY